MLNKDQLCKKIGITRRRLDRWLREGLPSVKEGRRQTFDPAGVAAWLEAKGKAESGKPKADVIATTRNEAARALGVSLRTLAEWLTDPTFPGKPGSPGRQDGYFPLAEIASWRQARFGGDGRGQADGGKLAELRERRLQLEIDERQVTVEKMLGSILDAQDMSSFLERHINVAKTALDQLADKIETRLPSSLDQKIRAKVRKTVEEVVTEACNAIAETLQEGAAGADDGDSRKRKAESRG